MISRAPLDVTILKRAEHDLLALALDERAEIARAIDGLVKDALPRGASTIHGTQGGHLRLRVGRRRVIYRLREGLLVVVAVTG